jgi:hypothetical protein
MRPGAEDERAVTRPNRRRPLSSKRTFNQVPAKTALVLTGSAIALAGCLGASSSDAGHDGRGAGRTGLTAALTTSHQAQTTGSVKAGTSSFGTGYFGTGLESAGTAAAGGTSAGGSTSGGGTASPSGTSGPGPVALAVYGTPRRHPRPPIRYPAHHQRLRPKRLPEHHQKHVARKHPARGPGGRLHGNPWQIAGSLMPAYHWTSWQFHYLNLLWMRESGWNRFACNHSSGAYGIPQAVPGDKMAAAGPDWRTSARTQIIWGMGYIQSRYGNPWNAWQHELRYGWY